MYKDLNTENIKLKQTIEIMKQEYMELVQTIEMQGQTIEKLNLSVAELKRRLVRHDNYTEKVKFEIAHSGRLVEKF